MRSRRCGYPNSRSAALSRSVIRSEMAESGESALGRCITMIRTAIITLSDKGSRGEREDESGRIIREMVASIGASVESYQILPDEKMQIIEALSLLSDGGNIDLIITTGGTGVAPRDVTPEATREVLHRELPGMAEAMRAESQKKTPHAMLSRALAGIRNRTLIINLPGSPRAVRENLAVVLPALAHAVEKIHGDPSDCARA
jgi:molybdopterin adenylyltransferase